MKHRSPVALVFLLILAAILSESIRFEYPSWYQRALRSAASAASLVITAATSLIESLPLSGIAPSPADAAELPVLGAVTVNPTLIPVGLKVLVVVNVSIPDSRVIPASVVLQRLDASGKVIGTLGTLHDDGQNGDAEAGDNVYSGQAFFQEFSLNVVRLRVSAAFRGVLQRVSSTVFSVNSGYTIQVPVGWELISSGTTLDLVSPETYAELQSEDPVHIPPDVTIATLDKDHSLFFEDFVDNIASSQYANYLSRTVLTVNGHSAVRYDDFGSSLGSAPVVVVFIEADESKVLMLTLGGYEDDNTRRLREGFDRFIESISF